MKAVRNILCLALALAMLGTLTCAHAASSSFSDVPASYWAYESVMDAAEKGYVNGVGDGRFNPEGTVTYAEFISILTRAFYPEAIPAAAGGSWYDPYVTAATNVGILYETGITTGHTPVTKTINRADMALLIYNIMNEKGKTVTIYERMAAKTQIGDLLTIMIDYYQNAIADCYAAGIITGYSDGYFHGTDTMTRAQACVILGRLEEYLNGTLAKPTMTTSNSTTSTDTSTYKLANGKPVTEENVLELLAELQIKWPDGTSWGYSDTPGTNYYVEGPSEEAAKSVLGTSAVYACGGYAAMISDSIFGRDGNPARKVTDMMQVRPGDIITIKAPNGVTDHVVVAVSGVTMETCKYTDANGNRVTVDLPYVYVTDGNNGLAVRWPRPDEPWLKQQMLGTDPVTNTYTVVYTRYPD